jgi:hypothetical protein
MGWWSAIWALLLAVLELVGARYGSVKGWVKEEIDSKPKSDVM